MLLLGGAMTAARALHAQQPERVRRIGVLNPFPANDPGAQAQVTAFVQALGSFGWVEGKNSGSTTALPRAIQPSLKPMRQNWSAYHRT